MEVRYGNGGKVAYEYDDFDRVTGIKHDDAVTARFTTEYDVQGRAASAVIRVRPLTEFNKSKYQKFAARKPRLQPILPGCR